MESQFGNLEYLGERGFDLLFARILQPPRKAGQHSLFLVLPGADDEREAEPFAVFAVVFVEQGGFLGAEFVQAAARLLASGGRSQCPCPRRPSSEVGMGPD